MITLTDVDLNANSTNDHAKKIGEILRLKPLQQRDYVFHGCSLFFGERQLC